MKSYRYHIDSFKEILTRRTPNDIFIEIKNASKQIIVPDNIPITS